VPKAEDLRFKPKTAWKLVGQKTSTYDQKDIVTGKAQFGLDVFRDGMVYASIEHPPVLGGTAKSVDDKAALAVKGVQQTVALDTFKPPHLFQPLGGVAVIANSTWAAIKGRRR
jgi:isoquinoline 1-oxidoreductase beta subunit